MDTNQTVYDRDSEVYLEFALMRPERDLLARFGDRWPQLSMLDVGIGTGRTTYTFGAVAGRYVGLDYSPRMVEVARRQAVGADDEGIELLVADARDLPPMGDPFDVVLFSFNGLDSVGHEDRLAVLAELRRVIGPDGHFLFSTHSLNGLPLKAERPRGKHSSWLRTAYAWAKYLRRLRRIRKVNKGLDLEAGRRRGWMIVRDGAHDFRTSFYYVDPEYQLEQLREAGFEVVGIYDLSGKEIEAAGAGDVPWLHFHCRPAVSAPS